MHTTTTTTTTTTTAASTVSLMVPPATATATAFITAGHGVLCCQELLPQGQALRCIGRLLHEPNGADSGDGGFRARLSARLDDLRGLVQCATQLAA
mgnify:CR=1 FL=1